MSARRKRVISTEEIQFNHKPAKMLLTEKRRDRVSQNGQTPSIIGICSYCVLDRPVFEQCQTLLHPELTPWWSFLLADGGHHKKPHTPCPGIRISNIKDKMVRYHLIFTMGIILLLRHLYIEMAPGVCSNVSRIRITINSYASVD